jgi:hypothetical protein
MPCRFRGLGRCFGDLMNRLGAFLLALATAAPAAHAAEVTRIASSMEDNKPFGMYLDLTFEHTQERGKITRDHNQGGALVPVSELRYTGTDSRLKIDAHIGLWKDLEFHYGLPIVFAQDESWGYAGQTDATNSTITNNCLNAAGFPLDPACPTTGAGAQAMFPIPNSTERGGLGDMEFGIAYAFFNQAKDDTKPTWILGFDYQAPTAEKRDPHVLTEGDVRAAADTERGKIGDRVHRYTIYTTFSRDMAGLIEPYFHIGYTIPVRGGGWYSNCDHPDASNMGHPENCGTGPWTRAETGIQEPQTAKLYFGAEAVPFHDASKNSKVTVDLRAIGNYIGGGRYYNELSGMFLKLMSSDDYFQLGGRLGVTAQAADFISFKLAGSLLYNTDHSISAEPMGQDLNKDGKVDPNDTPELNPNFDFRSDLSTRNFRMTENTVFTVDLSVSFNF